MYISEKSHPDNQLEQIATNTEDATDLEKTVQVDTLHQDEAMKVLASYEGPLEWTPEEEKKVVRKIDRRLLSLLVLTYGLQYYDKAMLSQAVRNDRGHLMQGLLTDKPRPCSVSGATSN